MQEVKYSIILPVYNGEKNIKKAIESVLHQHSNAVELIIVNDGSTDKTLDICKGFVESNIVVIDKENSGVSDSRNHGIEIAKGRYVLFLDSDDWLSENAIQIIDEVIHESSADLICFNYDEISDGKILKKRECNQYGIFDGESEINQLIKFSLRQSQWYSNKWYGNFRPVWNKCFKKETIDKYNIRFEPGLKIGEDMAFVVKMLCHAQEVLITDRKYYNYYNNPESVMHTRKWHGSEQGELYFKSVERTTQGRADDFDLRELWLETAENDWNIICKSDLSLREKLTAIIELMNTANYIRFSKLSSECTSRKEQFYLWCIRHRLSYLLYFIGNIRAKKH